MKAVAIALPLLIAATFGEPAAARAFDLTAMNGQLVVTIGKSDHVRYQERDYRKETRRQKKNRRFDPLPPRKIARMMERRGFYNIRKMRTDGRVYTMKARGKRGNLVRLTVNARNGKIIDRRVLRRLQRVDRWDYDRRDNRRWNNRWNENRSSWDYQRARYPFWMY